MRLALLTLLLFTSLATGQPPAAEPIIQFPAINTPTPPVNPTAPVQLDGSRLYVVSADVPLLAWSFPEGVLRITPEVGPIRIRAQYVDGNGLETREFKAKHVLVIEAVGTGRVSLLVLPAGSTSKTAGVVKVIDAAMAPRPPPGPDPKPDPKPEPKPDAPIPVAGFRVLIVYETGEDKLTPGQRAAIFGRATRDYLDAKCVMGPDGKTKEYRIYDKDISLAGESKLWQDAMKLPRASVPWLIISNGTGGYSGPLPASLADTTKLLKTYGGE